MVEPRKRSGRALSPEHVEEKLRRLETEMEDVLTTLAAGATSAEVLDPVRRQRLEQVLASFADRMQARLVSIEPPPDERVVASALELLSPAHLLRFLGRWRMRQRSEQVDDFGADPKVEQHYAPWIDFLYRQYFRVAVEGVGRLPDAGRCLLVANRSGGVFPWDALMIKAAAEREHRRGRRVRWLTEDLVYHQPFLGSLVAQLGGVRACQENAQRLLCQEEAVCVFPEGMIGATKLFRDRYRLGRFGRGGYVRLALRTGTPVIPVAVLGAEESRPVLARVGGGGKRSGGAPWSITPTFPWLGPLGLLPLPSKWWIIFGEPIRFEHQPEEADDVLLVRRLNEQVRSTLQSMISERLERLGRGASVMPS